MCSSDLQIAESSFIGDYEIKQYIKDRTVIEDTESTIDMGLYGWRLHNYPERLSYSATPPDFGSLCIQRRRWANGGLLIVPKLRRQSRARRRLGHCRRSPLPACPLCRRAPSAGVPMAPTGSRPACRWRHRAGGVAAHWHHRHAEVLLRAGTSCPGLPGTGTLVG